MLAEKAEKEQLLAQVESQLDQSETLEAEQARLAKRGQITKTVPTAKAKPANDPKEAEILEYEHLTHEERLAETKKQKIAAAMAKAKLTKLQLRLEKSPETASETQQEIEEVRQAQKQAQRILSTLNKLSVQEKN